MSESGVKGYEEAGNDLWFGIFAPARTPAPVVDRLHAAVVKAMNSTEIGERLRSQSYDKWTLPPKEFAAFVANDHRKWGKVIRSEEHTSELQSLMRISYAVFCLKKKKHSRRDRKT